MSFDRCDHERSLEEAECIGNWKTEQTKKARNKRKEGKSKPSPKIFCLGIKQTEQFDQQVTPLVQILIGTYHIGVKQALAKRNRFECVSIGEKNNVEIINEEVKVSSNEAEVIKYVSLGENFTLIL